jgi:hypothetical protein
MRLVLLVCALLAELAAAAASVGLVVHTTERHMVGLVALGLVLYLLALQPVLPVAPPSSRR